MSCVSSSVMLIDFQGHILDLAGSVIISFTRNTPATANQAVCSMFFCQSFPALLVWSSGDIKFISYDTSNPSPLFMQAIGSTTSPITFDVNCLSSTTGTHVFDGDPNLTDSVTGLAHTAWPAENGSVPSPVTYENIDRTPLANLDLRGVGLKDLLLLLNYSLGEFDERGVEVTQSSRADDKRGLMLGITAIPLETLKKRRRWYLEKLSESHKHILYYRSECQPRVS
ncbi:hypothetical protein C8J57DRAFT_1245686 [Mycena rebaudengoi]|nr:hypothetical protein C8J57DRAFT_1255102 [Mycena rebaudengoi]KAJ7239869.1 hypothetical protein C8J57DRAFT_1245686 [Mycena rebaudengoi]